MQQIQLWFQFEFDESNRLFPRLKSRWVRLYQNFDPALVGVSAKTENLFYNKIWFNKRLGMNASGEETWEKQQQAAEEVSNSAHISDNGPQLSVTLQQSKK